MQGPGTGQIRTKKHVPNQYADPDNTAVKAVFTTENEVTVQAVREFSNRSRLQVSNRPEEFRESVTAANQGLIHLSRDELLKLVIAAPGSRKDQIYDLMNTEGIDSRRKQLKRLAREVSEEADSGTARYEEHLDQLQQVAGDDVVTHIDDELELRTGALLNAVNARRERLGADPISSLDAVDSFQQNLTSPIEQASSPLQREDVQQRLETLIEWTARDVDSTASTLADLREELRTLRADQDTLDMLTERSLVEQGLSIVDSTTTACPLCKESCEPAALEEHLKTRAERLARIDERIDTINRLADDACDDLESIRITVDRIVDAVIDVEIDADLISLDAYRDALGTVIDALSGDLTAGPQAVDLGCLKLPIEVRNHAETTVKRLQTKTEALPDQSIIEITSRQLQTLDEAYQGVQRAAKDREKYARAATELDTAHKIFLTVRDAILGETFEIISDRFAAFYEAVNPDESDSTQHSGRQTLAYNSKSNFMIPVSIRRMRCIAKVIKILWVSVCFSRWQLSCRRLSDFRYY